VAIVFVHEALVSGEGEATHDSGNKYVRVFDVLTDSYDDNAITVANAVDPETSLAIPAPYSYFTKGNDTDYGSIVTRIRPERSRRLPKLWHVTVEYTVIRPNTSNGQWPVGTVTFDVTLRLPGIRIWGIPVAEVLNEDINGDPVVNSAGQLYQPRPEDIYYRKAVEITWWCRTYDFDDWDTYEDSTNNAVVWGCAAGTLLMQGPPNGVRNVDTIGTYYEMRTEIHYDKKGWKKRIPDMGRKKLVNANLTPPSPSDPATGVMPIDDEAGLPVTEDVPLDGNGQPLALGQPWVIDEVAVKAEVDWAGLGLPALNITFSSGEE